MIIISVSTHDDEWRALLFCAKKEGLWEINKTKKNNDNKMKYKKLYYLNPIIAIDHKKKSTVGAGSVVYARA